MSHGIFHVAHPKGERKHTQGWDGTLGYWSAAMLRKVRAELETRSGVRFRGLKTFRFTFIQTTIDALVAMGYKERAAVEVVQPAAGRRKLETTMNHYGRIRKEDAHRVLLEACNHASRARPG